MLIPYQSIHAQKVQHAQTVEQCRADQKLWFSKEEQLNSEGIANLSFNELTAWGREMSDCLNVDPRIASEYYNTLRDARAYQLIRLTAYIDRHNLYHQFLAEERPRQGALSEREMVETVQNFSSRA